MYGFLQIFEEIGFFIFQILNPKPKILILHFSKFSFFKKLIKISFFPIISAQNPKIFRIFCCESPGFSSFSRPAPPHFKEQGYEHVQVCMVDCPGHASLIRTIIGGGMGLFCFVLFCFGFCILCFLGGETMTQH